MSNRFTQSKQLDATPSPRTQEDLNKEIARLYRALNDTWNELQAVKALIPSSTSGPQGAVGPLGFAVDGLDGEMGPPGVMGLRGAAGAAGVAGVPGPPGMDGMDADEPIMIPGPAGAAATASTSRYEPLTDADATQPEIVFDSFGDVIMVLVP